MNSFREMQRAIEFEVERQTALLREGKGEAIVQETRLWSEATQVGGGGRGSVLQAHRPGPVVRASEAGSH